MHEIPAGEMLATDCYECKPLTNGHSDTRFLHAYYAATALFLALDLVFDINLRVAFFDASAHLRGAYYAVCFACLALMLTRPAWTVVIAAFESLVTLAALIIAFGSRALLASDAVLYGSTPLVRPAEVVNFVLGGGVAYVAWVRGIRALQRGTGP